MVAQQVRDARKHELFRRGSMSQKQETLVDVQKRNDDLSREISETERELFERMQSVVRRLKKRFGLNDNKEGELRAEISSAEEERHRLFSEIGRIEHEIEKLDGLGRELPSARRVIDAYYESLKDKPLSLDQKRNLLKPDFLSNLSMEEYVSLWRRLNPHFVSHVTRQGFRDHNAMVYHSGGMMEFHDGFSRLLGDGGSLQSPLDLKLKNRDADSVKDFLSPWVLLADDVNEAKRRLGVLLEYTWASAPKYPDETAFHFAAQKVLDDYYGGEEGNEIFFIYPSDVIASQYYFAFNGAEKDFTRPQSEDKWNDVFVWQKSQGSSKGISLDAGLVFLPAKSVVDAETGSLYASKIAGTSEDTRRVLIEDTERLESFADWVNGPRLFDVIPDNDSLLEQRDLFRENVWSFADREEISDPIDQYKDSLAKELVEICGFAEKSASRLAHEIMRDVALLGRENVLTQLRKDPRAILDGINVLWRKTEKPVSSKQYWEQYFEAHPESKPAHIYYYDGDPTAAVHEFLRLNNIGKADTSKDDGVLLGFGDNHIENMSSDERVWCGYDELKQTALKIIEEHYVKKGTSI